MGFFQFIMKLLGGGQPQPGPQRSSRSEPVLKAETRCSNDCGRTTSWSGHALCRTCWKEANAGQWTPSHSQMNSYNKVVAIAGPAGKSEADFRATLINNRSFDEDAVNALCSSPTVRQLMGW